MLDWFPASPYLARADAPWAGGSRPINQGDVFRDLPIAYAVRHPLDDPPKPRVRSSPGILVTHPCSSRSGSEGRLLEQLAVSPLVPRLKGAPSWEEPWPWNSHTWAFPLPGLLDGEDYVVDLRRVGMVRREFLVEHRTAVLNLDGFAAFQARLSFSFTRLPISVQAVRQRAEAYFLEFDLWQLWTEHKATEDGFQPWLEQPSPVHPTTTRREALKADYDEIKAELEAELGELQTGQPQGLDP